MYLLQYAKRSIKDYLASLGGAGLPPPVAIHFALQILEALAAVHAVNCSQTGTAMKVDDLKLSNCMLGRGDRICECIAISFLAAPTSPTWLGLLAGYLLCLPCLLCEPSLLCALCLSVRTLQPELIHQTCGGILSAVDCQSDLADVGISSVLSQANSSAAGRHDTREAWYKAPEQFDPEEYGDARYAVHHSVTHISATACLSTQCATLCGCARLQLHTLRWCATRVAP